MAHAERLCDRLAIIAKGRRRFEGTVAEARGMLPMQATYTPRNDDEHIADYLPEGAQHRGEGWRFTVPDEGTEQVLSRLISAGYGISGLSIERPSLHDAFVRIVGRAALEDQA